MAGMVHTEPEEAPPSDNLYISDLPPDTTEDALKAMFGPGVAQCRVLPSKNPGQGTCVALVRFSSVKEAVLVRETLNGAIPPGYQRPVTIRFCGRPEKSGNSSYQGGKGRSAPYDGGCSAPCGGGFKGGGGGKEEGPRPPNDNLYVTGLPPGIDQESVKQLFGQYGTVTQCKVLPAPNETMPRHALVRFTSAEEATTVKKSLTGYALEGVNEPLVVEFAIKKDQGKGGEEWAGNQKGQDNSGYGKGGCCKGGCCKGGWGGGWGGWGQSAGCDDGWGSGKGDWDGGKGWSGGKGCSGGKGFSGGKAAGGCKGGNDGTTYGGMDQILHGFQEAQCLPGNKLGNEDNCLFISGLPRDCDDVHLYRLLAPFGAITPTGVKAMKFPDGACKGFGFVNFINFEEMQAAAAMLNGTQLPDGSTMTVVQKKAKRPGAKGKGGESGYSGESYESA